MNRVVFQLAGAIGPGDQQFVSISLEEPPDLNSLDRPFNCLVSEQVFADAAGAGAALSADSIKLAGCRLYAAVSQHPELMTYLTTARNTAIERYPVYVEIAPASGAEAFPWEALCFPDGQYLALDQKLALARQVRTKAPEVLFYRLTPPIRIAAVLSCLGITATGELGALRQAAKALGEGQVELLVLASEEQLVVDLQEEMAAGTAPEVGAVEVLPPDIGSLQARISAFGPHVLHFFCHGSLEGKPHLRLALKDDWEVANPGLGIAVEASQFQGFKMKTDDLPWLVVLNCCEGAAPDPAADAHSLALGIAFQGVAPAVVGMREPVVSDVANTLTEGLYTAFLSDLADRIATASPQAEALDWAKLLVRARERLATTHHPGMLMSQAADGTKEWTLPVVYVRPQEFRLQVLPAPENETEAREARLEIEALQAMLRALQPGQAPELRAEAEARIGALAEQLGVGLSPEVLTGGQG
jgi:hypothetical protein